MNCKIELLDNLDNIQTCNDIYGNKHLIFELDDGCSIKVPRVKKTLGSIFDELANFLNQSSKEQRDNYATIYIYDDNDYYHLIAIDKDQTPKFYKITEEKMNNKMTLHECRELAKNQGWNTSTFNLCGKDRDKVKCKWIDANLGILEIDGKIIHAKPELYKQIKDLGIWCDDFNNGC